MLIKLPITQIPQYWELIKMSVLNADGIPSFEAASYSKELLIKLLCEEFFCIIMHKDNQIQAVCIFEFKETTVTKKKLLHMHSLYAVQKVATADWVVAMDQIKAFAKKESCERIYGFTNNKRLEELFNAMGYNEGSRYFVHHL